jgi:hypothetical protein
MITIFYHLTANTTFLLNYNLTNTRKYNLKTQFVIKLKNLKLIYTYMCIYIYIRFYFGLVSTLLLM